MSDLIITQGRIPPPAKAGGLLHPSLWTQISVAQLLADFDAILDRVEIGECFHITEDNKPALVLINEAIVSHLTAPRSAESEV